MPLTRFVKGPDQIARFQAAFAAPAFLEIRTLSMSFESDPAVLAELLPPPLELAPEPRVTVSISQIGSSNCVGPFNGADVRVSCVYRGEPGVYSLTMPMSTDTAVIFGRELYAEPKKLAEITLSVSDSGHARASVTRHGVAYIELRGIFEDPMSAVNRDYVTRNYYVKFLPSADGLGFANEPELVRVTHRGRTHRAASGTGTITFRESAHDPIIDIPVLSVAGATLSEGETHTSAEVVETIPADVLLPYAFGKMDDLVAWAGIDSGAGELKRGQ